MFFFFFVFFFFFLFVLFCFVLFCFDCFSPSYHLQDYVSDESDEDATVQNLDFLLLNSIPIRDYLTDVL